MQWTYTETMRIITVASYRAPTVARRKRSFSEIRKQRLQVMRNQSEMHETNVKQQYCSIVVNMTTMRAESAQRLHDYTMKVSLMTEKFALNFWKFRLYF